MENVTLMQSAREALKGKWTTAILTFVIYSLIAGVVSALKTPGSILWLLLAGPFALGLAIFSLNLARNKEARPEQISEGFNHYGTATGAYLLMLLFIFLWTLLFIIPGIVAAFSYVMTFYIIADDPGIRAEDALKKSRIMMDGYKLKLFYLFLRFFLLSLLCILTLGIGFFWLIPFVHVTMAKFYDDIR